MDEFTGGVDLGLNRDLTVRINVVRKLDWGGSKELDLAQPFEAFTDRRHRRRSRPRQRRRHRRRWRRRSVVGAAHLPDVRPDQHASRPTPSPTKAKTITGRSRRRRASAIVRLVAPGSYSLGSPRRQQQHRRAIRTRARYNWELPETYQGVRLSGTYELPWQILVASTFTAQQGEYFPRVVQVRNALEHARQRDRRRPGRPLRLGEAGGPAALEDCSGSAATRIEGMFDLFNVTNTSVVLRR